ncbi:MlaD family protein [Entomobacter blattae]|uniref:MlaD protein n=1 Tax=Entomobacter blattae TaxID=2762277 RepID=A0A7H1NPJ5_9PROT|nr:MlaD family protein [Entomobacter blattae]QNT77705.1 MlaD protein [Entomobacter blattae]
MGSPNKTTVGAFVLGGFILLLSVIFFFGKFNIFSSPFRAAVVFQDSISGLSIGAPVTFRGVKVGSVQSISIKFDRKAHTAYIPVIVQLDPSKITVTGRDKDTENDSPIRFSRLIELGLRAQLNLQSFVTGQSQINLDFARDVAPVFHPNVTSLPEIPTEPSTFEQVTKQISQLPLQEISHNLVNSLHSIKSLADKLDTTLPDLLASFKGTSEEAHKALSKSETVMGDVSQKLDLTLVNLSRLAKNSDTQINARGAELHTLLVTSNQTIKDSQVVIKALQEISSPRSTIRMNLNAGINDLAATAASLRGFANEIERNPQLLLMGRRQ